MKRKLLVVWLRRGGGPRHVVVLHHLGDSTDTVQRYCLKRPQFEETKTHVLSNHTLIERCQNESQKGENCILEIPDHPAVVQAAHSTS